MARRATTVKETNYRDLACKQALINSAAGGTFSAQGKKI